MFKQSIKDGWQQERPDHWLQRGDPWQVLRPEERVEVKLNCSFNIVGGKLQAEKGKPSRLFGIPRDLPIVGYGGHNINSLRLWAAAAPHYFHFEEFSHGDFVGALAEKLAAETLTRVLYPDDSTSLGQGYDSCRSIFLSPARWPTSYDGSDATTLIGAPCPIRSRSS
jgi:starch phosphorylase